MEYFFYFSYKIWMEKININIKYKWKKDWNRVPKQVLMRQ